MSTNPLGPSIPPERAQPKSIRPMGMGAAAGWAFLITALFLLSLGFVGKTRLENDDGLIQFACQAIAYLLGLFGILRLYGPDSSIRDFIGLRRTSWLFFPIVIGLGISTTIGADLLYTAIVHRFPWDQGPELTDVLRAASPVRRVLICLAIAVAGPFIEELIFRGALFRPLKKQLGSWETIVVTAILFTLIHIFWQKFPPLIVLAMCLGAVRQWSGSIWVSFVFHATFNGVGVLSSVIELNTGKSLDIPDEYEIPAVIGSVVVAVLLLILAKLVSDRSLAAKTAQELDT